MTVKKSKHLGKFFYPLFCACFIIIALITLLSWINLFNLDFLYPSVSMEKWPAYDESYRLDTGGEEPTNEELAYYIATKIPDVSKNGLEKIIIKDRFEAVRLEPEVGYDNVSSIYDAPYTHTVVVSEGLAVEVQLNYEKGSRACSMAALQQRLEEGTDCYFARVRAKVRLGDTNGIGKSCYIPIEKYQKYFPDYVIQPET